MVLADPRVRRVLDFTVPMAVLTVAVRHFFSDADDPFGIVARYRDAVVPGSFLVISHATREGQPRPRAEAAMKMFARHSMSGRCVTTWGSPALCWLRRTIPPMLHVHGCLFGVLDADGTLKVPDEAALSDEDTQRLCDAIGEGELADRMIKLGYGVENTAFSGSGHNFEIAGVPKAILEEDFWRNTGCAVAG
jgi:hypothetical protein